MKYLVSRHLGAMEWCKRRNIDIDKIVTHLNPDIIQAGDVGIGTLPIPLVAIVNARQARYLHLSLSLTDDLRCVELDANTMEKLGATLQEFTVHEIALAAK